jgi:transposase
MEMVYVGIDVSKDRLDVHVLPEGETFVVARDGEGLAELVERMGTLGPERIAIEATGGFETVVAAALAGASLPVVVVNPAQVRHFAQAPREDRSDRREPDRPLRRGDQAGLA